MSAEPSSSDRETLRLTDPTTGDLQKARDWARRLLGRRETDVEVVMTELLTNAILHGAGGPVVLGLTPRPDTVVVVVENHSSDAQPLPMPANLSDTVADGGTASAGGRGLLIASAISEHLTTKRRKGLLEVTAIVPRRSPAG